MWQPKALRPSSFEQWREKGESKKKKARSTTAKTTWTKNTLWYAKAPLVDFTAAKVYRSISTEKSLWGAHRAYAIMDDQSNASIIFTELADKLNTDGPEWKYFLSTFGSNREVSVTRNDYDVSLSIEDRRFTKIMGKGIHKNQLGSWEMPQPFCSTNVFMRNKRS